MGEGAVMVRGGRGKSLDKRAQGETTLQNGFTDNIEKKKSRLRGGGNPTPNRAVKNDTET